MSRVLFDIFDFINYLFKTLCKEVLQCLVMIGVQIQLQNDFVKIILFSTVNISGQALDHD